MVSLFCDELGKPGGQPTLVGWRDKLAQMKKSVVERAYRLQCPVHGSLQFIGRQGTELVR
jgi:hypothetical protein